MAEMTEKIKSVFEKQGIVVFATASKSGSPNAVPIAAKKIINNETILISDQYFGKTLKNINENPHVAVTFWDQETFEGYQFKGTVTIETSGKRFEETTRWIEKLAKAVKKPLKSKGAVIMKMTDIYCVTSGPDAGKKIA